ncbi:MAG: amidohydrolase family protein, partial [Acidimicrobiaceae bacterium]|nr:amidohydrolase family protein [Acidimicrobiaceae bacterium]
DGNNASNYADMHRAAYLVAGLFKDARMDPQMFPAEKAYEMATLGGARTMLMADEIGSLEPWRPLLNVMNQLVWSADGRGVHTVFVDGAKVVDAGRMTTVDEDTFYARCQAAGEAITARSGIPDKANLSIL